MKKSIFILFTLLFAVDVFSQTEKIWDMLRTSDGEMAVKLPAGCYSNFYNRDGIAVYDSDRRERYRLTEMRLISCYHDRTLMSLEIYDTEQATAAAKVLGTSLKIDGEELNLGEKFYSVEKTEKTDKYFSKQRIIAGRKRVYIITAATRGEPNDTMRFFLDSISLTTDRVTEKNSVLISSLENTMPEVVTRKDSDEKKTADPAEPDKVSKTFKPAIRISIPAASYSVEARQKRTTGRVVLRLTLGAGGKINRLQVVRDLPFGLVREAVIAALRIKFLPAELDGAPRSTTQLIEYNFGN